MLLYLSITGIILTAILLIFQARPYRSFIFLGGFFFLISLYGLLQYGLLYSGSVVFIGISFFNFTFLTYLIGPLFYWYIRSVISDRPTLTKQDLWHLLPSFLFLITSLPYLLSPWSGKLQIATHLAKDIMYMKELRPSLLYRIFPAEAILLSRPVQVLIYVVWSAFIFIRWRQKKETASGLNRNRLMTAWLTSLIGFLCIVTVSHMLILTDSFVNDRSIEFFKANIMLILSGIGFTGLMVSPFFFPSVLYGLPRLPESMNVAPNESNDAPLIKSAERRNARTYQLDYLQSIKQKTDSCMLEQKPFLKKEFNLAHLSTLIQIPVHHLAFYFREHEKQSFLDYRNAWRIRHAKLLMHEGYTAKLTLEAIGLLSGFSSRNTFFVAFKKVEGVSPRTYSENLVS